MLPLTAKAVPFVVLALRIDEAQNYIYHPFPHTFGSALRVRIKPPKEALILAIGEILVVNHTELSK